MTLPPLAHAVNAGDASWTFDAAQPGSSASFVADASTSAWDFDIREPSVDSASGHEITARPAAWAFAAAEPSHSSGRAAGSAAWTFAAVEPAVTKADYIPLAGAALADVSGGAAEVVSLTASVTAGSPTGYSWVQTFGTTALTAHNPNEPGHNGAVLYILCPRQASAHTLGFQVTIEDDFGGSVTSTATVSVGARRAASTQTGKGPTLPLPHEHDGYKFLASGELWPNRPGRNLNYSNATNVYTLGQDGRQNLIHQPMSAYRFLWVRAAFMLWEGAVDVTFTEVADDPQNNIRVGEAFLGISIIGDTGFTNDGRCVLVLNPDLIDDHITRTPRHEAGHVLGLDHPTGNRTETLMETQSHADVGGISIPRAGDLIGSWHLWGPAGNAPNTPPDVPASFELGATEGGGFEVGYSAPLISGGQPVLDYSVHGPTTAVVTGESHTFTGLAENVANTFFVTARNSLGAGLDTPHVSGRSLGADNALIFDRDNVAKTGTGLAFSPNLPYSVPRAWLENDDWGYLRRFDVRADGSVLLQMDDAQRGRREGDAGPNFTAGIRVGLTHRSHPGRQHSRRAGHQRHHRRDGALQLEPARRSRLGQPPRERGELPGQDHPAEARRRERVLMGVRRGATDRSGRCERWRQRGRGELDVCGG